MNRTTIGKNLLFRKSNQISLYTVSYDYNVKMDKRISFKLKRDNNLLN